MGRGCPARGEYLPRWGRTRRRFPQGTGRAAFLHLGHVAVGCRGGSPALYPSPAQHQPGTPGADPARSCFGTQASSGPGRVLGFGRGDQPVPSPAVGESRCVPGARQPARPARREEPQGFRSALQFGFA